METPKELLQKAYDQGVSKTWSWTFDKGIAIELNDGNIVQVSKWLSTIDNYIEVGDTNVILVHCSGVIAEFIRMAGPEFAKRIERRGSDVSPFIEDEYLHVRLPTANNEWSKQAFDAAYTFAEKYRTYLCIDVKMGHISVYLPYTCRSE